MICGCRRPNMYPAHANRLPPRLWVRPLAQRPGPTTVTSYRENQFSSGFLNRIEKFRNLSEFDCGTPKGEYRNEQATAMLGAIYMCACQCLSALPTCGYKKCLRQHNSARRFFRRRILKDSCSGDIILMR